MVERVSNNLPRISGEILVKPRSPSEGRGNKIPNGDDSYVIYVGTEPISGRVWLVYSEDVENCPDLFEAYCEKFDQQFSTEK